MKNLFDGVPTSLPNELVTQCLESQQIRIERIVSTGQSSPADFWYDQDDNEWVVVLQGSAQLEFQDQESVKLTPGDFINIPAHQKHRVAWTNSAEPTIWLAIFYR